MNVTLDATDQKVSFGKATIDGSVYNGDYAGPVLRVHAGDLMNITLINHLKETTNLHFHGIDTSPLGRSDNIHIAVKPGDTFTYQIKVPQTQPPGLYWFHDHIHGITEKNVMNGLSGTVIVEGFVEQFPEFHQLQEHVMVLKDYEFEESPDPYVAKTLHKYIQSINGQTFTTVSMQPGETQLWRIVNQSADYYFNLVLKGHKFRIIGRDGVSTQKETDVDEIKIMPASRLEVLVDAGEPGTYDLISEGVPTGEGKEKSPDRVLGKIIVNGSAVKPVPLVASFPAREDLSQRKVDAVRTVVFSQSKANDAYYIDGHIFDHNRIDTRVPLGNVEEWTIRNDSNEFHEFHIHQVSFQVTEINGVVQPFDGYVDNVRVPEEGEVKVRLAFTDPVIVGVFVYHCHVLGHEDKGMMAQIEVYDPKVSAFSGLWHRFFTCCGSFGFNKDCMLLNFKSFLSSLTQKSL